MRVDTSEPVELVAAKIEAGLPDLEFLRSHDPPELRTPA
jgi:hypothetical protein